MGRFKEGEPPAKGKFKRGKNGRIPIIGGSLDNTSNKPVDVEGLVGFLGDIKPYPNKTKPSGL
jgi:hypothetical protein